MFLREEEFRRERVMSCDVTVGAELRCPSGLLTGRVAKGSIGVLGASQGAASSYWAGG